MNIFIYNDFIHIYQASTKDPPSPLRGHSISISRSQWSFRGSLLSCKINHQCIKICNSSVWPLEFFLAAVPLRNTPSMSKSVLSWSSHFYQWKLTQAVATQVPQSAYVSTVMFDNAVRINGIRNCHNASTCVRETKSSMLKLFRRSLNLVLLSLYAHLIKTPVLAPSYQTRNDLGHTALGALVGVGC